MLKTAKQYIESLKERKLNLYLLGEKVEDWVNNPIIKPSMNAVAMTYKMAHDPKTKEMATAKSMLTGKIINRFNSLFMIHLHFFEKKSMDNAVENSMRNFKSCTHY